VCPTGALVGPNDIDASRCISYLTIEHKGSIPTELRPLIGEWLFGCDLCQEVCPLNVRAQVTDVEDFVRVRAGDRQSLERILGLRDHADLAAAFGGSPLMRAGRRGLVRNACVVAANVGAVSLLPRLRGLAADADPVVAEHAAWAVAVLEARGAAGETQPSITPQPRQTSPS
jgi:epoxyqueuosine reductase